jgi:hypothetical protein
VASEKERERKEERANEGERERRERERESIWQREKVVRHACTGANTDKVMARERGRERIFRKKEPSCDSE